MKTFGYFFPSVTLFICLCFALRGMTRWREQALTLQRDLRASILNTSTSIAQTEFWKKQYFDLRYNTNLAISSRVHPIPTRAVRQAIHAYESSNQVFRTNLYTR